MNALQLKEITVRALVVCTALLMSAFTGCARGQRSESAAAPEFVFITAAEGAAILGARDDYVRASLPLDRAAKLHTAAPVGEEQFMQHMRKACNRPTSSTKFAQCFSTDPRQSIMRRRVARARPVSALPCGNRDGGKPRAPSACRPHSFPLPAAH